MGFVSCNAIHFSANDYSDCAFIDQYPNLFHLGGIHLSLINVTLFNNKTLIIVRLGIAQRY